MREKEITIMEHKINSIPVLFIERRGVGIKKVIFLFHRLLNNKVNELPVAYILANNGYFVVSCDMYGHGDREESCDLSRKYDFDNVFKDIYHTASDIQYIIAYLKEHKGDALDFDNIGAVGTSIGGSVALVSGYLIDEIKYVASMVGTNDWNYIIDNKTFNSFRFHARSKPVMDYEKARDFAVEHDPVNNYNDKNIKPLLFLNGMLDTTIPITIASEYAKQLKNVFSHYGKEDYIEFKSYHNVGHEISPEMINDLLQWLKRINDLGNLLII